MVKTTSLTTAAINALTTGNSSILYNNQTRDLVLYSGSIGFVESSIFNLEINNINGECLILKHNSSLTNYVNFNITNQGQLNIITNGTNKIVNISHHNGSTSGLSLGGTLVLATATELNKLSGVTATTEELNYVDTTPGTAEASKALVVDSNRDISNIRNLQTENLTVNGTLVTSSATELNYNDIATIGTAEPAKALVVDMNKDISGIRNLSATNLSGTMQTANQPNITLVGTLISLSTNSLTLDGTQVTATADELNKLSGATFNVSELNKLTGVTATTTELNYVDTTPGTAVASKALVVDSNRDISNIRNLQTENLTVNGTLVTSSATELNYNDIAMIGTAEPAKALVVNMDKDISGIRNLSATNLSGTMQTANQPNITSVGTLTSLSTNSLTLNGTQVTSTASELNVLDGITTTTTELNKLHGVTATTNEINKLAGLTTTTNELNILNGVTATYTEINVLNGITATTNELNYVDILTPGTAEASKAIILDSNKDIVNINNLTATNLTGTLATASQPNVTSVGTLTSLSTNSLTLNGTIVTSTAAELNRLDLTTGAGTAEANKALVLDNSRNIENINILGVTTIELPAITSNQKISLFTNGVAYYGFGANGSQLRYLSDVGHGWYTSSTPSSAGTQIMTLSSTGALTPIGILNVTNNTSSTSTTTGALIVTGGVGIGGALNVGTTAVSDRIRTRAANTSASFIGNWDDTGYWGFGENGTVDTVRLGKCDISGTWTGSSRASLALQTLFYAGSLTSDSDYRLKTDVVPLTYGLNEILNINAKKYKLLSDNKIYYGLIAHEVQEILPELVNGNKDAVNNNNEPIYQGIDYVKIVPVLINAVKELNTKNTQLEQTIQSILERLNNLEN